MSILIDKEIKALCTRPNALVTGRSGAAYANITEKEYDLYNLGPESSAEWLTDEAKKQVPVMIEPFESEQVRFEHQETIEQFQERMRLYISQLPDGHPESERNYLDVNWEGDTLDGQEVKILSKKVISYGLSSMGYDLRVGNKFYIFTNINSTTIDPKAFDLNNYVEFIGDVCIIPPNSFVLAHSVEYLRMPDDVVAEVLSKSTYARCGVNCLATPLEPGWEGHVTLEFANNTNLPAMLYAGEGACQVLFHQGNDRPAVTYKDRGGKYQGQTGITLPKV